MMLKRLLALMCLLGVGAQFSFAASDQWTEVRSDHFIVVTSAGEKQGRHLVDQFERMRWLYHTLFPKINADPPAAIQVYAVKNKKEFQAVEPADYLARGKLDLAGLFVRSSERDYILVRLDAEQEHPFATVYHEYTHLELTPAASWLPIWLNEGLAQFFQNTDIHDKDVILGQPSRDSILFLRQATLIPLPVLFRVDRSSPYYHEEDKGSIFYAESWALTHYLEVNDRLHQTDRIADYLKLVAQHEDPAVAAEKAFGDLKKLQHALEDYIQASSYRQFIVSSAAAPLDEASYKVTTLAPDQVKVVQAEVLTAVGRTAEAQATLQAVLQSSPQNADAPTAMGMLALRNHDASAARKWFAQAVQLNAQSFIAHYYLATLSMSQELGEKGEDDQEIESNLRAAIRLNPAFAPAYAELARFQLMRRQNLAEAYGLALRAVQLDPAQLVYRLNLAAILAAQKNYPAAREVLATCLKLAKNQQAVAMIQRTSAQIDQMQAGGSLPQMALRAGQTVQVVPEVQNTAPRHPSGPPTGPRHEVIGVIHAVACSYPAVLEMRVDGAARPVSLYTNNYYQLDVSALGYTPTADLHPCKDLEGRKARVQYAEVSDKTVDGQIVAIELRK